MTTTPGHEMPAPADLVLVLTEAALTADDVQHLLDIYRDPDGDGIADPVAFHVLVPADTERHLLASLVNHLGAGELREAWHDLTHGRKDPRAAQTTAAEQLAGSLGRLAAAGYPSTGAVIEDNPLPALRQAVAAGGGREVVAITYPHPFEDTFHSDWASRAREALSVPVLHLYAGTSEVG